MKDHYDFSQGVVGKYAGKVQMRDSRGKYIAGTKDDQSVVAAKLCKECGQPMRPKGVKKLPNEYDHAQGCRYSKTGARKC